MKTKDITFLAIGIALFVTLSMCLRVPVFENYYLCLGYIVMTVYIWCFNWYEGAIIGFLGVILYCIIGGLGFIALMAMHKDLPRLKVAAHDRKGLTYAIVLTLFGPVFGVSLSLMAVQYTDAGIASTLMALTPVLIILPYAILFKQRIRFKEIIGVTVSMIGVAMFFLM